MGTCKTLSYFIATFVTDITFLRADVSSPPSYFTASLMYRVFSSSTTNRYHKMLQSNTFVLVASIAALKTLLDCLHRSPTLLRRAFMQCQKHGASIPVSRKNPSMPGHTHCPVTAGGADRNPG